MVSVEARELTWLTKNESKKLITSVGDIMPDIALLDEAIVESITSEG
jgi:hypothetical protein